MATLRMVHFPFHFLYTLQKSGLNCLKGQLFLSCIYHGHGQLLAFGQIEGFQLQLIEAVNFTQQSLHTVSIGGFFKSFFTYAKKHLNLGTAFGQGLKQIIDAQRVTTNKKTGLKQPGNGFLTAQNILSGQFISLLELRRCQFAPSFPLLTLVASFVRGREFMAAPGTARSQYALAIGGAHALAETVTVSALGFRRLVGTLGHVNP